MLNLRRLAKLWIVGVIAVPAVIYWLHVQTELGRLHRRNQRSLDLAARQIEGKVANALTTVENLALDGSYLCEFIKTQPYLTLASQADCRSLESRLSFDASDCQPASAASLRLTSPRPIVELPTNSQPELLRFEVDLERLLRDAPFEDVFGNLFIADAKGAVVAAVETKLRLRRGGLRLRSLDQLGLGESRVAFADLQRVAGASPVALTGGAFRLYTQPLTLPARAPDGDASPDPAWVLGALVAEDVLMADALALPTHLVWLLFLLPIVGALSWPLLRLLLLHPRERLRFTEAYWLLLSTSATAMLGVLLLLQFDSYRHQRRQSFERLERLADGIETGLSLEFLTLRDYLDRSTPKLRTEALRLETASSETWEKTGIPGFRQMVLIDERGCQIFKTRSSGRNTPNVSVSQREYFQAPMENRLWEGEGRGFFVQSFRSITTGEFASSLTIRLGEGEGRGIVPPPTVAAVSFKPVTVTDPVLRPGYGFAIIDEGGGIIYHSDAQRALHETIFEETEEARRLEGLLYALQVTRDGGGPSSLHLDLDYRTRPHLLAVRAMKEPLPWLIATFQEKRLPATLNAEIVAHALVFCGIYFVIVNGVPALVCIFFLRRRMEWAWPAPAKISLYRSRILLLLGPLVLLAAAAVGLSGWGLLFSALLIPALALPMLILNYIRWSSRGSKDSRSSNYIAWNVAGLAVLFVVLSMLPAYAFYKLSWQGHQAILAFYEREEMRRAGGRAAGSNADAPSIVQLQDGFPDEEPGFADDWAYPRWPQFIVNLLAWTGQLGSVKV